MDVDAVLEGLNETLVRQHRSVLQYSMVASSVFGLEYQGLVTMLREFAEAELDDARLLVEKITALGGAPSTDVEPLRWTRDPAEALQWLADDETVIIDGLKATIPHTGNEGRSEALEHLLEHVIMRKQNQVDWMLRALRRA